MSIRSQVVPNLIQGVSQQSAQQRRDSQCEEQFDCINSPKDGCVSRNGFEVLEVYPGLDLSEAFCFESIRGLTERYVGAISAGEARFLSLVDGSDALVTAAAGYGNYLEQDGGSPRDNMCVQVVDDFAFVATKQVAPALKTSPLSPVRPKEALFFFKAGNYLSKYSISIVYNGNNYKFSYTTPDNSVAGNQRYILTAQLAATFYRAMTGNSTQPQNSYGIGAQYVGDAGGSGAGQVSATDAPVDLETIGFGVEVNGNLLRVWRTTGDFEVDVADDQGDTALVAIKDSIRAFSDLPKGGFEGFGVRVHGVTNDTESQAYDYYVVYEGKTAASGAWVERPFPGIEVELDAATMPHAVVNTAPGTYEVRPLVWSDRIAGDGVDSAKDPYFLGRAIQDIFYHEQRLGLLSEGAVDFSKARNVYTHFPDTVQTVLADAPINFEIAAAKQIVNLRKAVTVDETLLLWGDKAQFRIVTTGSEPFKQSTVDAKGAATYKFAEKAGFAVVSNTLYFVLEPVDGDLDPDEPAWASLRNVVFQQGKIAGDTDATAHVSEYIPAGVRRIVASDTGQMLLLPTDGDPTGLYVYNYLMQGQQVAQSAWNKWRCPGVVLWTYVDNNRLCALLQRPEGVVLARVPLSNGAVDAVAADPKYRTRMDLRVDQTQVSGLTYSGALDRTSFTLPWTPTVAERPLLRVALSADNATRKRGRLYDVVSVAGAVVTVDGDLRSSSFYAGLRVSSERLESEFFIRSEKGIEDTESTTIEGFSVRVDKTGYTRLEVTPRVGRPAVAEMPSVTLGSGELSIGGPPNLVRGKLRAGVVQDSSNVSIRLVNDSILPSRWQSAQYEFRAVSRSAPSGR